MLRSFEEIMMRRPALSLRTHALPWMAMLFCLIVAIAGCASTGGPRILTFSEDELARLVMRQLPLEHKVLDLFGLKLDTARLRLLPERNRVAAELNATATEALRGNEFPAQLAIDFGLRFNEATQSIEMADVKVNRLQVDNVPSILRDQIGGTLGREIAQELLSGLPLYTFRQNDLKLAAGLGLRPGAITVTPRGVEVALVPVQ